MGEIAESMLDGSCCEVCGAWLGEPVGYAVTCDECSPSDSLLSEGQVRRARNREQSNLLLRENGYDFDVRNGAAHLIVRTARGVIDFWPGTGKWIPRFLVDGEQHVDRGVKNLIAFAAPARAAVGGSAAPIEIHWMPHMAAYAVRAYQQAGFVVNGLPADFKEWEA
ncbi:hypothetical protein WI84_16470 [Burkholderia ubonensis]|uniref:hypothetical protein n=1 Tax=Burkholderia ubonensis TaxID=101571 RepID=UPI00075412B3|nr:hypothetical protein [Burkholderia ubonensis]KVD35460.1 hypothetical protein WI84_16470 [Burkholderia ubonensis]